MREGTTNRIHLTIFHLECILRTCSASSGLKDRTPRIDNLLIEAIRAYRRAAGDSSARGNFRGTSKDYPLESVLLLAVFEVQWSRYSVTTVDWLEERRMSDLVTEKIEALLESSTVGYRDVVPKIDKLRIAWAPHRPSERAYTHLLRSTQSIVKIHRGHRCPALVRTYAKDP